MAGSKKLIGNVTIAKFNITIGGSPCIGWALSLTKRWGFMIVKQENTNEKDRAKGSESHS